MSARTISAELVAAFKRLRLGGLLPTLTSSAVLPVRFDAGLGILLQGSYAAHSFR